MSIDLTSSELPQQSVGVIADLIGTELCSEDRAVLDSDALSGLILFARNYHSPQQLQALMAAVRHERPGLPVFVDQEGGRVQRFRDGFSRLPPMAVLGDLFRRDATQAKQAARYLGQLMAAELVLHGVDCSFAPVLDVERGCSRVIGDRAFGTDPAVVVLLAAAFVDGMASAGMKAVGKHFPGHGAVEADSHKELPVDPRSYAQLLYDMRPFRQLIADRHLQGIMPAHVVYPAIDSEFTAGFSRRWMQLLRSSLGFDGVVFSDDLTMEGAAASGSYSRRAELAMAAGCNALVVCNVPQGAVEVLTTVQSSIRQGAQWLDLGHWCVGGDAAWAAGITAMAKDSKAWLLDAGLL